MIVGEYCLTALLQQCERALRAGPKGRGDKELFDELTRGVVLIAAENAETLRSSEAITRQLQAIDDALECGQFGDWVMYERIPFDVAAALINGSISTFLIKSDFIAYLGHPQSGIRAFCCRIAWAMRDHLTKDDVVHVLLENVACTLGFVELSAGLARSFFEKQGEFFDVASAFKPADQRFEDQYRDRIADLKDGNLIELILLDLVEAEASLRKQLSQRVFALSLPNSQARSPQQLEIPLLSHAAKTHPPKGDPSSAQVLVEICSHLQDTSVWPALKSVLDLYSSSHLDYRIARCEQCSQLYLTCFWEFLATDEYRGSIWTSRMAITEEEAKELECLYRDSRQADNYLVRIEDYFKNDRDKIVQQPDGEIDTWSSSPIQVFNRLSEDW